MRSQKNYRIPKGATVIGNVWAVGRDPEYFPDPEHFNPRRWIDKQGKIKEDLKSFPFGFGRRCVSFILSDITWHMLIRF